MADIDIYYFSGTGNSLHAASELQKRLPEAELIPMVSLMHQETIKTNAETVGFIFPLHMMTTPIAVKQFFRKIELSSASYVFALVTRIGTPAIGLDKILRKRGRGFDGLFFLNMPDNDPKMKCFQPSTPEDWARMEAALQAELDFIAPKILNREKVGPEADRAPQPVSAWTKPLVRLALFLTGHIDFQESFYADENCTGCGTCEEVCLSGKIEMADGEPAWKEDTGCYMCFACVDFCPEASVQIASNRMKRSYTTENGRYHHPDATPEDIAAQKRP